VRSTSYGKQQQSIAFIDPADEAAGNGVVGRDHRLLVDTLMMP
jgi:hypothetical protein